MQIKVSKYVPLGTIVLNHGWVTCNEMGLFDQRFPSFDPTDVNRFLATNKVATNHAGTPGRAWESYEFPGWPQIPAGVEPTNYPGPRFDEYAQPGAPLRDDDDPTWFKVERAPRRIQVPAIDNEDDWETLIQVQNAGDDNTGVIVFFWAEYSGRCPSSDPGPLGHACKWVAENGVWSLQTQDIPSTAKSAIIYSVDEALFDQACWDAGDVVGYSAGWRGWEDDYEGSGEAIAVIVQRQGPNDHDTLVSSAYPGISENQKGEGPPYKYFAPYAMRRYHNLDTEIIIQNSGKRCTQVWLDYQRQGDDDFSYSEKISQLAPGESIRKRVPAVLGVEWLVAGFDLHRGRRASGDHPGSDQLPAVGRYGNVVDLSSSFLQAQNGHPLLRRPALPRAERLAGQHSGAEPDPAFSAHLRDGGVLRPERQFHLFRGRLDPSGWR
ncbi:MAG: hypothetical protein FJ014_18665 [Chloroflexi bacterium]|nr:hypothetical protein [Chloroflexota bacterium]